jgi:succinate dehydrogenase/fumarate reductase iron-sulfur protein
MKITVTRFDPTIDVEPYDVSYDVPYYDKMTALEALMYIYENFDPIAFDYSCHGRTCGRCGMLIDGEAKFACIGAIDDKNHTIAPLPNNRVIHDLIVDQSEHRALASKLYNRIRTEDLSYEELNQFDMTAQPHVYEMEWCTRCGRCTSVCPAKQAHSSYVGPMAMLGTAYRYYDSFDQGDRVVEAVQNGMYHCIMCGNCTQVCNSDEIDHLLYWKELRDAAEKRDLKPRYAK